MRTDNTALSVCTSRQAPESWSSQPGADSSLAQGDELNEEVPEPEDYRPFQDMLQFALESLLAAPPSQQSTGTGGGTGGGAVAAAVAMGNGSETLPAVCKVLRSVKLQMQVADDSVRARAVWLKRGSGMERRGLVIVSQRSYATTSDNECVCMLLPSMYGCTASSPSLISMSHIRTCLLLCVYVCVWVG